MKNNDIRVVSTALWVYFLANALIAAICLLVLLWIPTDPKKCLVFSAILRTGLALIVVFIFIILFFVYLGVKSYRNPRFNQVLVSKGDRFCK